MATDLRTCARTEIREVEEPFVSGQKGSSAMPHKKNPVGLEQICGMSRLMRSYALAALENINLWDQRHINSSVERIIIPDSNAHELHAKSHDRGILKGLKVYPDRMLANLNLTGGLIFSEEVLLKLVSKGLSREEAYEKVQSHAMATWEGPPTFKERVTKDPEFLKLCSSEELESCFDLTDTLSNVDYIFKRIGLV